MRRNGGGRRCRGVKRARVPRLTGEGTARTCSARRRYVRGRAEAPHRFCSLEPQPRRGPRGEPAGSRIASPRVWKIVEAIGKRTGMPSSSPRVPRRLRQRVAAANGRKCACCVAASPAHGDPDHHLEQHSIIREFSRGLWRPPSRSPRVSHTTPRVTGRGSRAGGRSRLGLKSGIFIPACFF